MTRKELYQAIKKFELEEGIKRTCGTNYTQVSNVLLEKYVKTFLKRKEAAKAKRKDTTTKKCNSENYTKDYKKALIKLVSILQAKKYLTDKEAVEILEL